MNELMIIHFRKRGGDTQKTTKHPLVGQKEKLWGSPLMTVQELWMQFVMCCLFIHLN